MATTRPAAPRPAPTTAPARRKKTGTPVSTPRRFDARPDTVDFRDRLYEPTLVEVPTHKPLSDYLKLGVPVLDQGREGACTGFGLATVAHCLLRQRKVEPDRTAVSARMLYDMARRYDEWEGENYDGASARGAMKGWYKHGVCAERAWPYRLGQDPGPGLTSDRARDAARRPLGAYLRVNHRDLVAVHAALAEVGILYASATVHAGWNRVGADGLIPADAQVLGGHAFAVVAYDADGLWIQNSWGKRWGKSGCARIGYADWLANATDLWVARLGVPLATVLGPAAGAAASGARSGAPGALDLAQLRPHVVNVGNDGRLRAHGDFGMGEADLVHLFRHDIRQALQGWTRRRLVLHAHGGLVPEQAALSRLAAYRPALLAQQAYLLGFAWHSDYWSTLKNMLQDVVRRRRPEGVLDRARDFLLDRLDDGLEPLARLFTGKVAWDEMKENALAASEAGHAAALVVREIRALAQDFPDLEVHLTSHSAGAVFQAGVVRLLTAPTDGASPMSIETCTWWAPACTHELFDQHMAPALQAGHIRRAALYTLDDKTERDDHCARIYNKSLLYLVSNAFENRLRPWWQDDGEALLGLHKFSHRGRVGELIAAGRIDHVIAPNGERGPGGSTAKAHGDFDDDGATVKGSFERITGGAAPVAGAAAVKVAPRAALQAPGDSGKAQAALQFNRSQASLQAQRLALDDLTRAL